MGVSTSSGKKPKSDINITPYIDILLVLLIIFMVIQPKTQYDLDARVPQRPTDEMLEENVRVLSDAIVVSLDARGSLLINSDPVTLDQLGTRLFDIYKQRSNRNMFIQGDPDLSFGDVVRIIDIAKGAGVGDVGLMARGGG